LRGGFRAHGRGTNRWPKAKIQAPRRHSRNRKGNKLFQEYERGKRWGVGGREGGQTIELKLKEGGGGDIAYVHFH